MSLLNIITKTLRKSTINYILTGHFPIKTKTPDGFNQAYIQCSFFIFLSFLQCFYIPILASTPIQALKLIFGLVQVVAVVLSSPLVVGDTSYSTSPCPSRVFQRILSAQQEGESLPRKRTYLIHVLFDITSDFFQMIPNFIDCENLACWMTPLPL